MGFDDTGLGAAVAESQMRERISNLEAQQTDTIETLSHQLAIAREALDKIRDRAKVYGEIGVFEGSSHWADGLRKISAQSDEALKQMEQDNG